MCFQGYAHHTCGCTRLFEEECDYAKELDTPFYLKVACPNYAMSRKHSAFDCGKGGAYCANVPDAAYLEYVFDLKIKHETDVKWLDKHIEEVIHPRRRLILATLEQDFAGHLPSIKQAYMSSPQYLEVDRAWMAMLKKKAEIVDKAAKAVEILRYARDFYLLQRQMLGISAGNMPALPDVLRNFSVAPLNPSAAPLLQRNAVNTAPPLQAPRMGIGTSTKSSNGLIQPQPRRLYSLHGPDPFGRPPVRAKSTHEEVQQPPLPVPSVKASPPKRGARAKKTEAVDNNADETPSDLRRSTRVRGKKVNYNEPSDEYTSAPSSPEKSDISSYSPTKSDASYPGARVSRGSSSLRDMIGEYQKQSGSVSTPAQRPSSRSQPGGASSRQRGLLDIVPQIRVDSPRSDTPDTDILQPDDPRHNGVPHTPIQQNNSIAPFAAPAFRTLGDGNPDPALLAFQQAYQQTRMSVNTSLNSMQQDTPQGTSSGYSNRIDYSGTIPQQQTQSILGTNISPPKLVQYQTPNNPTEPRKRPMPASSPILPSNKRVELSFPSSYISNTTTSTATSASSPPKPSYMQRQDSGLGFTSPPKPYDPSSSLLRPPQPSQTGLVFKPTAQTFKPSGLSQVGPVQDVFTTSVTASSLNDLLSATADATQNMNEILDLDWTLLSDGSKF